MHNLEGRDFFDNIRRSVKISHFVASIIPLALLVYFSVQYVYPYVSGGDSSNIPIHIGILLVLAVVVSVLGLILSTKATNSSIESAQELNTKINSLFDITKQFRETLHLDILLKKIMESAMALTSAESGALILYDEERNLKCRFSSGTNSGTVQQGVLKPGEGIAAQVAETGKAVLLNDVSKDGRFNSGPDNGSGHKTTSVVCVPLIYAGETIGVIELRNRKQGHFTKQDESLLSSLADQASISIAQNRARERQHSDFIHITEMLVGAQDYIQNRKGHARRVASYANLIGKELNFSDAELKKLYHASLLHDIGMLKIDPNDIWDKGQSVHHPKLGHDMIKSISQWRDSADIILYHHERYDGNDALQAKDKDDIPLSARVLVVADTFDVLTSQYSFTVHLDPETAIKDIESNAGTQFDPVVVKAFKSALTDTGLISS
ncbi:MAG: GAF domain-containing protein [Nitrospiraceae bacterium]|nr:MAG: GAF domain-containing protein [Nitrospiraceae bacterium]